MSLRRYALALAAILAAALPFAASAESIDPVAAPAVLVAKPDVAQFYRGTVLFVRPIGNGAHVGFIINRPTDVTLGSLFPMHVPSQKVSKPVLLGGPAYTDTLFALVQKTTSPGGQSIPFAGDVFLAFDLEVVDRIIEQDGNAARFMVGLVLWRPGELAHEIRNGFWLVREPDAKLLFGKPADGLWEELIQRSRSYV
jgi:putative transcriptional regulator